MKAILQFAPLECAGCMKTIEYDLFLLEGVQSVHVFPNIAKVRVEFDPAITNQERIEKVMEKMEYPVLATVTN
jgi:copper chaperone CopZ